MEPEKSKANDTSYTCFTHVLHMFYPASWRAHETKVTADHWPLDGAEIHIGQLTHRPPNTPDIEAMHCKVPQIKALIQSYFGRLQLAFGAKPI